MDFDVMAEEAAWTRMPRPLPARPAHALLKHSSRIGMMWPPHQTRDDPLLGHDS